MKKGIKAATFLSLGVMALWFAGCGEKKVQNTEVPKAPETNETVLATAPAPAPVEKYVVKEGDTLWGILQSIGELL